MKPDELNLAFAVIGRAQMRSDAFAQKAAQGQDKNQAKLLRALNSSQVVQSRRFQMLMRGKIGSDEQNMEEAFGSGLDELESYLEDLRQSAVSGGNEQPARVLEQTLQVMRGARQIPPENSRNVDRIWVCGICGYLAAEQLPERCPVCGAVNSKFAEVD